MSAKENQKLKERFQYHMEALMGLTENMDWDRTNMDLELSPTIKELVDNLKELSTDKELISESTYEKQLSNLLATASTSLVSEDLTSMSHIVMHLKALKKEGKIVYLNSSSNTETTYTSSTTAHSLTGVAGVSSSLMLDEDMVTMFQSKNCKDQILNLSSSITLKMDGKPCTFKLPVRNTPSYLVDCKVYDMTTIPPNVVESQEMWKYALVRTKFYGNGVLNSAIQQKTMSLLKDITTTIKAEEAGPPKAKRVKNK
ncbi:GM14305 [Drosophila sechellia]|uniref:GM14305 n=1 Tax=Drosophila sechellia TaxID=7238 RepID=B4HV88_DROSE|nr:GM14305 [Drosophila sechellia]